MKCFYDIYDNKTFNDSMLFAFALWVILKHLMELIEILKIEKIK